MLTDTEIDALLAEQCGHKGVMLGWCSTEPECGSWEYDPHSEYWAEGDHHHANRELKPVALHAYDSGAVCVTGEAHSEYCYVVLDEYTESLDALFAPGGPVEKCREAGMTVAIAERFDGTYVGTVDVWGTDGDLDHDFDVEAPTPARALAEACYLALRSAMPTTRKFSVEANSS